MNKIKYSILLITALCISFSNGFADVNDNITVNKTGTGSFSASIWRPLLVYNAQLAEEGGQQYVRGATYTIENEGDDISAQYTIHGEVNKDIYFTVSGTPVVGGTQIKDDGDGVIIKLTWKVNSASYPGTPSYTGSGSTAYKLKPQPAPATYGAVVVTVKFVELIIAPDATPGDHVFTQIITVGYNPTF